MIFRNANRLLYNSRVMGIGAKPHLLTRSSPVLLHNSNRSYSLFWQRMGIELARVKIKLSPLSFLEAGGRYYSWILFEWIFVGTFIWACVPWFWHIQYVAHWCKSWDFHLLDLKDDTYRDPLIPPPDVWTNQNRNFIEEVKIRKARLEA
eukprot:352897_1